MKIIIPFTILMFLLSCTEKKDEQPPIPNKFQACNSLLLNCNATGEYCLFGFKWGDENDFTNKGVDIEGPKVEGGLVSFSFQEMPNQVSNHRQLDVPTQSFEQLPVCAKEKIRTAFDDWSSVANIQFEELAEDSDSDIKIFVASVTTCGNGFPNFPTEPCDQLAGHIIVSPNYTSDCEIFHAYALHEIGHSLGLGHSSGENLMGSINTNLEGLTNGDIMGIRQIYGE